MTRSRSVASAAERNTPHLRDNLTRMKMVLPVGKPKAWDLIATPNGIASWFPMRCEGIIAVGQVLEFGWRGGVSEKFEVKYVGEKHSAWQLRWRKGAILHFYLHGGMTTLTLDVEYPKTVTGRWNQRTELPLWAFHLANLKSTALGGPDLRNALTGRTWDKGFID